MAHYARTTPPVHPPERPQAPDQPWTGWWQPGADETPSSAAFAGGPRVETPTVTFRMPDPAVPLPIETPSAGMSERGGLRRVGVEPSGAPIAPAEPVVPVSHDRLPDWGALETAATIAFAPTATLIADAEFSVEGVARRTGDLVFSGISFPRTLDHAPDPGSIRLTITESSNVDLDSVAVATVDGFGPDRVGFTFVAAALNPGAMWVDGHYHVEQ